MKYLLSLSCLILALGVIFMPVVVIGASAQVTPDNPVINATSSGANSAKVAVSPTRAPPHQSGEVEMPITHPMQPPRHETTVQPTFSPPVRTPETTRATPTPTIPRTTPPTPPMTVPGNPDVNFHDGPGYPDRIPDNNHGNPDGDNSRGYGHGAGVPIRSGLFTDVLLSPGILVSDNLLLSFRCNHRYFQPVVGNGHP